MKKNLFRNFIFIFFLFTLSGGGVCQEQTRGKGAAKNVNPEEILDRGKYEFFKGQKTNIKNPFEMRDPFKRDLETKQETKEEKYKSFDYSNLPSIEGVPIEKIRIVGVLLGEKPRAIARVVGSASKGKEGTENLSEQTYILKEGMELGKHNAEIKAILPGGVVLAEKILNVYDQEEYLETILPVQTN